MDEAVAKVDGGTTISKAIAMQFRDGLLIALLSVFALRRRTVTALKSGVQLLKRGNLWTLEIPPEDVKGKRATSRSLCDCPSALTSISKRSGHYFPEQAVTMDFGLPTREGRCQRMRYTIRFAREPRLHLAFA